VGHFTIQDSLNEGLFRVENKLGQQFGELIDRFLIWAGYVLDPNRPRFQRDLLDIILDIGHHLLGGGKNNFNLCSQNFKIEITAEPSKSLSHFLHRYNKSLPGICATG
jgi:hypothetical protein